MKCNFCLKELEKENKKNKICLSCRSSPIPTSFYSYNSRHENKLTHRQYYLLNLERKKLSTPPLKFRNLIYISRKKKPINKKQYSFIYKPEYKKLMRMRSFILNETGVKLTFRIIKLNWIQLATYKNIILQSNFKAVVEELK